MSQGPLLIANLGAEEGGGPAASRDAAVRAAARLWRGLFSPPAFDWLPGPEAAVAWLNTEEAAREASAAGRQLSGAPPEVVRRVHDKAFALWVAESEGLVPDRLKGLCSALDAEEIRDAATALRCIAQRVEAWPAWAQSAFTLKPRLGSSGRGRVAVSGLAGLPAVRGALPRLAQRGGLVLEPWLERSEDLSAQLWLGPDGSLRLVGTTGQLLAPSGLYRGQCGSVDSKGRVASGSRHDEAVREAAARVAQAASRAGYSGPCGLDAFAFRSAQGGAWLRPVVEWNARHTLGHVVIGWVRRSLPALKRGFGLAPGKLCHFHFRLDAPADWPPPGDGLLFVPLGEPDDGARPGLLFAQSAEALAGPAARS